MSIRRAFLAVLTSVALAVDMWVRQHNVMNLEDIMVPVYIPFFFFGLEAEYFLSRIQRTFLFFLCAFQARDSLSHIEHFIMLEYP